LYSHVQTSRRLVEAGFAKVRRRAANVLWIFRVRAGDHMLFVLFMN
jgi:hypothetical protein